MHNEIYCSTGCLLSPANNRNWRLLQKWCDDIHCEVFEFMVLTPFYDSINEIISELPKTGMRFPTLHTHKDIGTNLSDGNTTEALRMFRLDCELASGLGAKLLILHLWGGYTSDSHFHDRNLPECSKLIDIANEYNLTIAIENVPCSSGDPLSHWKDLKNTYPELRYIFDSRFAYLHGQLDNDTVDSIISDHRTVHIHISDFTGPRMSFRSLRPILHPGEGVIDFEEYFKQINKSYTGTITLESPVIRNDGSVDIRKLNSTLDFIRDRMNSNL